MTTLEAGIIVADVDRAAAFYCAGLGFEVVQQMAYPEGRVVRLRCGDAQLKLYEPAAAPTPGRSPDAWRVATGMAYGALHVDDADVAVASATEAGAVLLHPVTAHRPGARYALIADPDGVVWELLEERG